MPNLQGQFSQVEYKILEPEHPIFPRSFGGIVSLFRKTPQSIVCPHFWELRWAYGCPFDCDYCFLRGTLWGKMNPRYVQTEHILVALRRAFDAITDPSIFNSGELSDSLMNPSIMEQIADEFEKQRKHKLLLLTKSANVKFLVDRPRKQTIVSFSLNTPESWKLWEHRTAPPEKRIDALKAVEDVGYEVRVRIDPIFPIPGWREHGENLIYLMLSKATPNRVTLGTPRGLRKTLMYSKNHSWANYFHEDTGWGKKLSADQRIEIYTFYHDKLREVGYRNPIAICKETLEIWKMLRWNPKDCKCNCVL